MSREHLTDALKTMAREAGADLVGIADIGRFDGVDSRHHPASIFPETRSVIVLGKRIVRGCLRGVEEGTHMSAMDIYALNWVPDRFLAQVTVTVGSWLEDQRFEAVPLPYLPVEIPPMGVAVQTDRPRPNVTVDFDDAAVRAGLGALGATGMLMTPQYGHRQVLQLILTDAELVPDPVSDFNPCADCRACAEACPLNAIRERHAVRILDREYQVAAMDRDLCARCANGARQNRYHPSAAPHRLGARCMRACLTALEGVTENRFALPFRRRPAWRIGPSGVPELETTR